jgi:predicted 2-oxoglutarate/Fe(II)-dependent dioxygenase YbiX
MPSSAFKVTVGDPMPRIALTEVCGHLFDSWDQATAGRVHVYWLGAPLAPSAAAELAAALATCEAELHFVVGIRPTLSADGMSWLVDPSDNLRRTVGEAGPIALVVDINGRLAEILREPTADAVLASAMQLHGATTATVVRAQAPVLLVPRVAEPSLCDALIEHWRRGAKLADNVASSAGASKADAEMKRRQDVPVDDAHLFMALRDSLVRRVMPAILQAFQTRIVQIELPRVGCYEAHLGGWFRRHRDNTTPYTAHRQFALSLNLNNPDDYDGGEVRFPEFSRQLYRPDAGSALVFSCSLLHEVVSVTRGQRFVLLTFLHDQSRDAQYRQMVAEHAAHRQGGFRMRGTGGN